MKKFLAMALAAVMVLALAACGSKNDTADDTGDAQDAQGGETQKLIVGFDAEFPPFGFIAADGTYDGFDLAMAKELCARLGWEYEAMAIDWNSKDAELSSGTINCIWNGFTYTGRENDYTFSDPYVDNSIVMVVKADSGITSLADLAGKSVMAQAASSAVDAINENEDFKASLKEVVELGDYNMGFMDLAQGTVDAVAADLGVAQYRAPLYRAVRHRFPQGQHRAARRGERRASQDGRGRHHAGDRAEVRRSGSRARQPVPHQKVKTITSGDCKNRSLIHRCPSSSQGGAGAKAPAFSRL